MAVPETIQGWQCTSVQDRAYKDYTSNPTPTSFFSSISVLFPLISQCSLQKDNMEKKCRDGVVFVCPVLPAHCHPYTQFLWFLAMPSLHPSTFLENVLYTCLCTFLCTIVQYQRNLLGSYSDYYKMASKFGDVRGSVILLFCVTNLGRY